MLPNTICEHQQTSISSFTAKHIHHTQEVAQHRKAHNKAISAVCGESHTDVFRTQMSLPAAVSKLRDKYKEKQNREKKNLHSCSTKLRLQTKQSRNQLHETSEIPIQRGVRQTIDGVGNEEREGSGAVSQTPVPHLYHSCQSQHCLLPKCYAASRWSDAAD